MARKRVPESKKKSCPAPPEPAKDERPKSDIELLWMIVTRRVLRFSDLPRWDNNASRLWKLWDRGWIKVFAKGSARLVDTVEDFAILLDRAYAEPATSPGIIVTDQGQAALEKAKAENPIVAVERKYRARAKGVDLDSDEERAASAERRRELRKFDKKIRAITANIEAPPEITLAPRPRPSPAPPAEDPIHRRHVAKQQLIVQVTETLHRFEEAGGQRADWRGLCVNLCGLSFGMARNAAVLGCRRPPVELVQVKRPHHHRLLEAHSFYSSVLTLRFNDPPDGLTYSSVDLMAFATVEMLRQIDKFDPDKLPRPGTRQVGAIEGMLRSWLRMVGSVNPELIQLPDAPTATGENSPQQWIFNGVLEKELGIGRLPPEFDEADLRRQYVEQLSHPARVAQATRDADLYRALNPPVAIIAAPPEEADPLGDASNREPASGAGGILTKTKGRPPARNVGDDEPLSTGDPDGGLPGAGNTSIPDDTVFVPNKWDLGILCVLEKSDVPLTQDEIAGKRSENVPSKPTIGKCLAVMREAGLVRRPHGERSGETITDAGRKLLPKEPG